MVRRTKRKDLYDSVTDQIAAQLEKGARPWSSEHSTVTRPKRHNGEPYSGINILLLWTRAVTSDYVAPRWMTYRQAQELGGQVSKGEKGTPVVYASSMIKKEEVDDGAEVEREVRFLKIYTVFNAQQIPGLPTDYYAAPKPRFESEPERLANAESFIAATGAEVREGGAVACYFPKLDRIAVPPLASFKSREEFYGTVLHEIVHYSGHKSRLNRDLTGRRGSIKYAREELVAELGAAFLCADLEITPETREDHAAYLDHWLTVMKEDNRAIFKAAAHAQRAADFLHKLTSNRSSAPVAR
jgi:antirestriction protein ArdC